MTAAFVCSYFMEITMQNAEQYLAITALIFADGFFGVIAGVKREGFKTYKAVKILKNLLFWIIFLTLNLWISFLNIPTQNKGCSFKSKASYTALAFSDKELCSSSLNNPNILFASMIINMSIIDFKRI
jgi:hypothetical protein